MLQVDCYRICQSQSKENANMRRPKSAVFFVPKTFPKKRANSYYGSLKLLSSPLSSSTSITATRVSFATSYLVICCRKPNRLLETRHDILRTSCYPCVPLSRSLDGTIYFTPSTWHSSSLTICCTRNWSLILEHRLLYFSPGVSLNLRITAAAMGRSMGFGPASAPPSIISQR